MVKISELSKDVAKDYREMKKTKLQRTFVSASDAAENKISKADFIYKKLCFFRIISNMDQIGFI